MSDEQQQEHDLLMHWYGQHIHQMRETPNLQLNYYDWKVVAGHKMLADYYRDENARLRRVNEMVGVYFTEGGEANFKAAYNAWKEANQETTNDTA